MTLDHKTTAFVDQLNSLDFGPLAYKLTHPEVGASMSLEQAVDGITKYKGFLYLSQKNPDRSVSPSLYVDYIWHTHLTDTELYTVHCGMLFGHYLHHNPYFGKKDDDAELQAASAQTRAQARQLFGWDEEEWCGTGTPGTIEFLQKYLGSFHASKELLLNWRLVITCKPQITRALADVMTFADVRQLEIVQRELIAARLSPAGFENSATKLTPAG